MSRGLLNGVFSPTYQRDFVLQGFEKDDLSCLMRFDLLLFDRLIIPDTFLFDGALLAPTL